MTNQRDYIVENLSGSQFRSELNNILGDVQTNNSGSSEPTTTVAYKTWVDTGNQKLKLRNSSNNGWITLGSLTDNLGLAPTENPNFTGKYIRLPSGNNANRPSSPSQGDARLNTQGGGSNNYLEFYSGAAWLALATGAKFETFTSSGTFTPAAGKSNFLVVCTGGGGGAGGVSNHGNGYWGGAGGGGAGTAIRFYNSTEMGSSAACTVGAGGAAQSNTRDNGNNGNDSVFNPQGTGQTITGQHGGKSAVAYNANETDGSSSYRMGRPGWPGSGVNGMINITGEKAEFQDINNYTGATASGINISDMRSSGGGTFWGKGPGCGADGPWTNASGGAGGAAGTDGIIVVLSF